MLARISESGRAVAPRPPYSPRVGRRALTPPHSPPVGRRVPTPPLKRGVTLVELMISMLILAIVCIAWLQIICIQSARKEARRREAVERLVGMMDAFMYKYKQSSPVAGVYAMSMQGGNVIDFIKKDESANVYAVFDGDISPVGYQLSVVPQSKLPDADKFGNNWGGRNWLVGRLYNRSNCTVEDAGQPFFTLPVYLGL